jgi:hypothetical protein
MDYSPYLSINTALKFRESIEQKLGISIMKHNSDLAMEAGIHQLLFDVIISFLRESWLTFSVVSAWLMEDKILPCGRRLQFNNSRVDYHYLCVFMFCFCLFVVICLFVFFFCGLSE